MAAKRRKERRRMSRYKQVHDNVGFAMKSGEVFKLACCDCGLVHRVVMVSNRKGEIGVAMKRDKRATAGRRRRKVAGQAGSLTPTVRQDA